MCLNCKFFNGGNCENNDVITKFQEEVNASKPFNIGSFKIEVKHPERRCECWELANSITYKIFKK